MAKYRSARIAALGGIIQIEIKRFLRWKFLDYAVSRTEAKRMIEDHKKYKKTRIY